MALSFEQIINDIRQKKYNKLYFLMGEEPYFIDKIVDEIEDTVIDESDRIFNQKVFFGRDTNVKAVVSETRNYSMFGGLKVVIVKEAQELKDIEELEKFIDKLTDSAILVFAYKYKTLDKRRTLYKKLDKSGAVFFESKKLYDSYIPGWIMGVLRSEGYSISEKTSRILADYLGNDLCKIRNELTKLKVALPAGKKVIDEGDIEYNIGISKEFNTFELQNALGSGDMVKLARIIDHFGNNPKENPIIFTTVMLYSYFTKLLKVHYSPVKTNDGIANYLGVTPYFAKDYIAGAKRYSIADCVRCIVVLREIDKKSKGYGTSGISEKELYNELLYKLTH